MIGSRLCVSSILTRKYQAPDDVGFGLSHGEAHTSLASGKRKIEILFTLLPAPGLKQDREPRALYSTYSMKPACFGYFILSRCLFLLQEISWSHQNPPLGRVEAGGNFEIPLILKWGPRTLVAYNQAIFILSLKFFHHFSSFLLFVFSKTECYKCLSIFMKEKKVL